MKIRFANNTEFITTGWSGGTTTEYFIYPPGASYRNRDFQARISSACIQDDYSRFTELAGVRRYLTPLTGDVMLKISGRKVPLKPYETVSFSGTELVESFGTCRDFNLMLQGTEGSMQCVFVPPEGKTVCLSENTLTALYCFEGTAQVKYNLKAESDPASIDFINKDRMLLIETASGEKEETVIVSSDYQFVIVCVIECA